MFDWVLNMSDRCWEIVQHANKFSHFCKHCVISEGKKKKTLVCFSKFCFSMCVLNIQRTENFSRN